VINTVDTMNMEQCHASERASYGAAWEDCRELIRKNYADIVVVTIASSQSGTFAFSADMLANSCWLRRAEKPDSGILGARARMPG
jgi:fatty acid-binding protein DegV